MQSKLLRYLSMFIAAIIMPCIAQAQNTTDVVPPVIDVHFHAFAPPPDSVPFCPNQSQFLASDPVDGEESQPLDSFVCSTDETDE